MQNIFDSHAHYDDPRFDEDRDALLGSMAEHGVRAIMNVGNTTHANLAGIELAKQYPFIYCSIGITRTRQRKSPHKIPGNIWTSLPVSFPTKKRWL